MSVNAYVNFKGNCLKAVEFYSQVFGSESPEIMFYGDAPPDSGFTVPNDQKQLVMHTALDICGTTVMFSDLLPGESLTQGNNISLVVMQKNLDELKTIFNRLKDGGTVDVELQKTFFSKCYGSLTDKFGIIWQFMYDE